jgi:type I restriction enzyme S subunit
MQNGKHAIACGLIGGFGFGSTEFHVLRPLSDVIPEWVHRFLRQPVVMAAAAAHFTGAVGQQRVPPEFLASLECPLPPLSEQRRIAAILNEQMAAVQRARAAAEAQWAAAKALPAAYLRAVFESEEARGWPRRPLGEIGEIVSGVTLGRRTNDNKMRSVPYLRVANVKDGRLDLSDVYRIEATEEEIRKLRLRFGDLLLTEGGDPDKLGRGMFWEEQIPECIHQNHIFRVRFDPSLVLPPFVSAQIGSAYGKAYFLAHAKRTTGIATINQRVLFAFPIMVPSLGEQRRVVTALRNRLKSAELVREASDAQFKAVEELPAALLRRAFRGEL